MRISDWSSDVCSSDLYVRTVNKPLSDLPDGLVAEVLAAQIAEGRATLARDGVAVDEVQVLHTADMQFQGQSHLLTVAVPDPAISREALQKAFDAAYWHRFEVAQIGRASCRERGGLSV